MKKTMIALATLAAATASFAQANITGGVQFGYVKDNAGNKGFTSWGAYLDITATEDLGGGMSVAAFMELNADGTRGGGVYSGDRNLTLNTPVAALTFANSRSGGTNGAALVAPVNLWDGSYGVGSASVITRKPVDAVVLSVPVAAGLKAVVRYVESDIDYYTTPGAATWAVGGSYSGNGLSVQGNFVSTTFADGLKATLAAAGVTNPMTSSTELTVVYDAGVAKIGLGYDSARRGKQDGKDEAATLLSVSAPVGPLAVGVNYGKRASASFYQLGAVYNLSKRTNISAAYGNADSGTKTTDEYALVMSHSF